MKNFHLFFTGAFLVLLAACSKDPGMDAIKATAAEDGVPVLSDSLKALAAGDTTIYYYGTHHSNFIYFDFPSSNNDTIYNDVVVVHRTSKSIQITYWTGHPIPGSVQTDSFHCYQNAVTYPVNDSNVYASKIGSISCRIRVTGEKLSLYSESKNGCMWFWQLDEIEAVRRY